jgi:hypothetical protein
MDDAPDPPAHCAGKLERSKSAIGAFRPIIARLPHGSNGRGQAAGGPAMRALITETA